VLKGTNRNIKPKVMTGANEILKSQTGRKMIANLSYLKDNDKNKLSEYNWIGDLPTKQTELFNMLYSALNYETKVSLAFDLIKRKKLTIKK